LQDSILAISNCHIIQGMRICAGTMRKGPYALSPDFGLLAVAKER
jgi:hypothetical protein